MQRIPNIAENMFASKDEFKFGLRGLRKLFFPHFPGWLALLKFFRRAGPSKKKRSKKVGVRTHFFAPSLCSHFYSQVGSFNYDNTKMRYHTYYLPKLPSSSDSILDFKVRNTVQNGPSGCGKPFVDNEMRIEL